MNKETLEKAIEKKFGLAFNEKGCNAILEIAEQYAQSQTASLQKQIEELKASKWISVDIEPSCYETGDWDGKRSDFYLVENKEGYDIGRCYSGIIDGHKFCDWYDKNNFLIDVLRYQKIEE